MPDYRRIEELMTSSRQNRELAANAATPEAQMALAIVALAEAMEALVELTKTGAEESYA